jgi:hypothetical protein
MQKYAKVAKKGPGGNFATTLELYRSQKGGDFNCTIFFLARETRGTGKTKTDGPGGLPQKRRNLNFSPQRKSKHGPCRFTEFFIFILSRFCKNIWPAINFCKNIHLRRGPRR